MTKPTSRLTSLAGAQAYGLAVIAMTAAVGLTRATWPLFSGTPFALLFGAVAATAQWGSWPACILAVLLAVAATPIAFPPGAPWDPRTLFTFVPVALFASRLIASRNHAAEALRASEAELRATLEQARASEQKLRQAQKMEAVGQLVAGVAHNFNNMLTVTMGYTDALLERHPAPDPDRQELSEIRAAAERGAALTRQMLAFGRRHDATLARVDLGRTAAALVAMLQPVIRDDVQLMLEVDSTPADIIVDPQDIEQVVFNLVINARDALPKGGEIHVGVGLAEVEGGEYVRLRVRDTGVGMSPEVQAHLFEPFFTTKEVGQGTGLGLAFVHGIARQRGGFVTVDTAPGEGTTVSVYFPPGVHL